MVGECECQSLLDGALTKRFILRGSEQKRPATSLSSKVLSLRNTRVCVTLRPENIVCARPKIQLITPVPLWAPFV